MAIKKYNPTTPGRRGMTVTSYEGLSKVKPEKSLLDVKKKNAGRSGKGSTVFLTMLRALYTGYGYLSGY